MSDRLRVACVQLNSTGTKAENIERAEGLVARAAATGADLVVLPEKWTGIGPPEMMRGLAESLEDGETVEAMSGWARTHGVTLVGGSIVERREGREKLSNTCVVFDPQGEIQAVYRKIHMFDVEVGGQVYRESETEEPGEATVTTEVEGWKLGLTVCYDLRFPELYRVLAVEGARGRHRAGRVHALHRQGPLGAPAPGPGGGEPVLRRGGEPVGLLRGRKGGLRALADRRSLGGRARRGAGRGLRHLGGDRPRPDGGHSPSPALARQPPAGGLPLADRRLTVEAVLFDVDFTLAKPGPLLGPSGYHDAGKRFGLDLDPERYSEARAAAVLDLKQHPELEHDEEVWLRFTEDIVRGMGGEGESCRSVAQAITDRWLASENFELYEDVLPVLDLLRERGVKIGLVSNTSRDLGAFVEHFKLPVDAWIWSGRHGKVKPSPTIFMVVLDELGVAPEAAVMVGDSLEDDVEGARALGMRAYLVDRDGRAEVDDALPTLLALPALIGVETGA